MWVMMDFFSGRPNPAWRLKPEHVCLVAEALEARLGAPGAAEEPNGRLGFCGFVVEWEVGDPPMPPSTARASADCAWRNGAG
jgi:hypothetical protein